MQVSQQGLTMIAQFEGCILHTYLDSRGLPTIGVGHLIKPGESFTTITHDEAMALFQSDIQSRVDFMNSLLDDGELNQTQFDACLSLMYNIGNNAFENGTVYERLDQGSMEAAADAFLLWAHPAVLLARRQKERLLFLNGVYPT